MNNWFSDNWPRLTVGFLLVSALLGAILQLWGIPLFEASKSGIGDFDGQIVYSRTMKDPVEIMPKEMVKEIFIMDLKTGRNRQLTDHKTVTVRPEVSPAGPWVSYTSFVFHKKERIRNADMFVYNLLTRERKLLSYKKGLNLSGSFSRDGMSVYYTIRQGRILDIFKIGVDGKGFRQVTKGKRRNKESKAMTQSSEPAISPDGTRMVFVSDQDGRPTLYVRDFMTNEDVRILFVGRYNTHPRWSPDGKKIVFQGYLKGHFDIFVVDASGKNLRKITRAKNPSGMYANNETPDFSPDGKQVVFTSDRTGYNQVYIIDATGNNVRRLTFDTFHYFTPRWSRQVLPTGT